jgi:hypothetical protein
MKRVERSEILPLGEYEAVRGHFRRRIIEEKQRRRVQLGGQISAVFENHDTVLLQIQEMLRTERISREDAIAHEIHTYNELVPGPDQLSITLFVEIADRDERERMLTVLAGLERSVALDVDGVRVAARSDARDGAREDRTTAVHYFMFDLPSELAAKLRRREAKVALCVDHPAYRVSSELSPETIDELANDLA